MDLRTFPTIPLFQFVPSSILLLLPFQAGFKGENKDLACLTLFVSQELPGRTVDSRGCNDHSRHVVLPGVIIASITTTPASPFHLPSSAFNKSSTGSAVFTKGVSICLTFHANPIFADYFQKFQHLKTLVLHNFLDLSHSLLYSTLAATQLHGHTLDLTAISDSFCTQPPNILFLSLLCFHQGLPDFCTHL